MHLLQWRWIEITAAMRCVCSPNKDLNDLSGVDCSLNNVRSWIMTIVEFYLDVFFVKILDVILWQPCNSIILLENNCRKIIFMIKSWYLMKFDWYFMQNIINRSLLFRNVVSNVQFFFSITSCSVNVFITRRGM